MPSPMIYAELLRSGERSSEPYVVDRGIFFSIEEFVPCRKRGWSSTDENNAAADAALEADQPKRLRCQGCGEYITENELVTESGHTRPVDDGRGNPEPCLCGPTALEKED